MRKIVLLIVVVGLLAGLSETAATDAVAIPDKDEPAWKSVHRELSEKMSSLTGDLQNAHADLVARAHGQEVLLQRLRRKPQDALRRGYGVLPEIREKQPVGPAGQWRQKRYSLERLVQDFSRVIRDVSNLRDRAPISQEQIEPLVEEYERLRGRLRSLDKHLAYQAQWQDTISRQRNYFERQNRKVARVRDMQNRRIAGESGPIMEKLEQVIRADIAPFRATPGLAIERHDDGSLRLPVTIFTDIEDEQFLAGFTGSVVSTFNESTAAHVAQFQLVLSLVQISPAVLYPAGLPPNDVVIGTKAHLPRFPAGALVLTTGANATFARTGRAVILGPAPIKPRTLAHEFGHLLGFDDGYLRGFEGEFDDPFGIVIIEWTGLVPGLMGGRDNLVTAELIEQLIAAYSRESAPKDFSHSAP